MQSNVNYKVTTRNDRRSIGSRGRKIKRMKRNTHTHTHKKTEKEKENEKEQKRTPGNGVARQGHEPLPAFLIAIFLG